MLTCDNESRALLGLDDHSSECILLVCGHVMCRFCIKRFWKGFKYHHHLLGCILPGCTHQDAMSYLTPEFCELVPDVAAHYEKRKTAIEKHITVRQTQYKDELPPSRIGLHNVWIGGESYALRLDWLIANDIGCIVNVSSASKNYHLDAPLADGTPRFEYHHGEITDDPREMVPLEVMADVIMQATRAGKRVLVHCMVGMSRSVTAVCAWYIRTHLVTLREALTVIRRYRSIANPNSGFQKQLKRYADMVTSEAFIRSITGRAPAELPDHSSDPAPKSHSE
jgi:hypothetical protein